MDEISLQDGIDRSLDSLLNERLALLCGAGLSMAAPSSIPSAAQLAERAKAKYDATYGADRAPLPEAIEDQAQFFFEKGELETVYLRTYIDQDAFSARPNSGHMSIADLMLIQGILTTVSTNVDTLVETAGNMLLGNIGKGITRVSVERLPPAKSPLLKVHGCWSDPTDTIWAPGQILVDPVRTRIEECSQWLEMRLADRDLLIVGYWTDWDYLNDVLEHALGSVNPGRVTVVDPCDSAEFEDKAPALYDLGQRTLEEFRHVRCSGDVFLEKLRIAFSKTFLRRALHLGRDEYERTVGAEPNAIWLEPHTDDPHVLWQIRRDLEGCKPDQPAKRLEPEEEPLVGLTLLQLQARGAVFDGGYWKLRGQCIRVIRAPNRALHSVEADFTKEVAPAAAPDITIAVGAESYALPRSVVRGTTGGSVARGSGSRWLSRMDALRELTP